MLQAARLRTEHQTLGKLGGPALLVPNAVLTDFKVLQAVIGLEVLGEGESPLLSDAVL